MRKRLTDKVAADVAEDKGSGIMNDPYQVNNPAHEKNDPDYGEYKKGDPEAWAEGVNKDNLWKDDKRTETGHPEVTAKMAAEAVQAARKLEERAVKCIVASQRILPGAEDSVIECQAADLMHLPDNMVDALLGRQENLANSIAKSAADASGEAEEEDEKKEKEAGMSAEEKKAWKEKMDAARKKKEAAEAELAQLEKLAGDDSEDEEKEEESEEKSAGDEEDTETKRGRQPQEEGDIEEDHSDKSAAEEEEEEEEDKEEKEEAEEKTAGDNLLDDIFSSVTASEKKQGAKTLSGMVKKEASSGSNDDLSKVWSAPPDVSKHFQ